MKGRNSLISAVGERQCSTSIKVPVTFENGPIRLDVKVIHECFSSGVCKGSDVAKRASLDRLENFRHFAKFEGMISMITDGTG